MGLNRYRGVKWLFGEVVNIIIFMAGGRGWGTEIGIDPGQWILDNGQRILDIFP